MDIVGSGGGEPPAAKPLSNTTSLRISRADTAAVAIDRAIHCHLVVPIDGTQKATWIVEVEAGGEKRALISERVVSGDSVELTWLSGMEEGGRLIIPGYLPAQVRWKPALEEGRCQIMEFQLAAAVTGSVSPDFGEIYVRGCGRMATVEDDGFFLLDSPDGELCEIYAERRDGPYRTVSEPVRVRPSVGRDIFVELHLPERRSAGLGLDVMADGADGEALVITRVRRSGAAALAGLRSGDRVLAVDGVDVGEWGREGFLGAVQGLEGEAVELTVRWASSGARERLTLERIFLESASHLVDRCDAEGCGAFREDRPGAWLEE